MKKQTKKCAYLIAVTLMLGMGSSVASLLMCPEPKEDGSCEAKACDYTDDEGDVQRGICAKAPTPGPHEGSCICDEI